jgi:hypothetical protein
MDSQDIHRRAKRYSPPASFWVSDGHTNFVLPTRVGTAIPTNIADITGLFVWHSIPCGSVPSAGSLAGYNVSGSQIKGVETLLHEGRCAIRLHAVSHEVHYMYSRYGAFCDRRIAAFGGIDLRRDTLPSIRYSEQLNSITISATLQSTDRRYAIVG